MTGPAARAELKTANASAWVAYPFWEPPETPVTARVAKKLAVVSPTNHPDVMAYHRPALSGMAVRAAAGTTLYSVPITQGPVEWMAMLAVGAAGAEGAGERRKKSERGKEDLTRQEVADTLAAAAVRACCKRKEFECLRKIHARWEIRETWSASSSVASETESSVPEVSPTTEKHSESVSGMVMTGTRTEGATAAAESAAEVGVEVSSAMGGEGKSGLMGIECRGLISERLFSTNGGGPYLPANQGAI
ncbi:hypothetical protein DFH07DRAFT_769597 [Mycena maculata]|uniref:Uncharacterized protein n=1 Tax=Mycena maculata TaxID=230809 RepID=A0AAD7NN14_9AGAR|nr:hypothetical protein DFH07DRAFT_769597 [Mycena maculata]